MRTPNFTRVQAAFVAYVAGIFTCLLVMQCGRPAKVIESKESVSTGEYYYIDRIKTLHIDADCPRMFKHNGLQTVERASKDEYISYEYICTKCISDKKYKDIIEHNQWEEKLMILHRHLCKEYCDLGSLQEFKKKIGNPEYIQRLYKSMTTESEVRELGSLEEFTNNITSEKPVYFIYMWGEEEYSIPQHEVGNFEKDHYNERLIGIEGQPAKHNIQ